MTGPRVNVDAARIARDLVADLLDQHGEAVTVGIGVPADWHAGESPDHVQVDDDGATLDRYPAAAWHTIRITAWAAGRSRAIELANLARALVLEAPPNPPRHAAAGGTPALSARDGTAYLGSATVRIPFRTTTHERQSRG